MHRPSQMTKVTLLSACAALQTFISTLNGTCRQIIEAMRAMQLSDEEGLAEIPSLAVKLCVSWWLLMEPEESVKDIAFISALSVAR